MSHTVVLPSSARSSQAHAGAPLIERGMRVEAHPHRPKVKAEAVCALSVRPIPHGTVTYLNWLILRDAQFVVQSAGHARSEREQVRNVHAWVRGRVEAGAEDPAAATQSGFPSAQDLLDGGWVRVVYNPFLADTFRVAVPEAPSGGPQLGATVVQAEVVAMRGAACWAFNPTFA